MAARTPFYEEHLAAGAKMVEFAGWDMPVVYSGIREEHLAVRSAVGLFDVSHMGEVRIHGKEALRAVQWLATNDASELSDGQAQYAVLCNEQGGAVDDIFVYRRAGDDFLIVVNASNRAKDVAWMRAHLKGEAVLSDDSDAWALLAVQGPLAEKTLQPLVDLDLSALASRDFAPATVAGLRGCLVARTGYTGEDGFEVFAPADRARPLWGAILDSGRPFGILPCGLGARDTLRLEVRNPLYGHELNDETSPFQAGVAFVVKLDKPGGFVGAEALRARKGHEAQRVAGLVLDGKRIAREGMAVLHQGEPVGHVTSGTRSPSLDRSICLAYVRSDLVRPGTRLSVDVRGRIEDAEVVKGPFYQRT
jgi:glycine cleavage system T protein (aminomethyltransferase)